MNEWKDYVNEVREKGFENASPLARLIWTCEVGHIDQHASIDLKNIAEQIAELEAAKGAAEALIQEADLLFNQERELCDEANTPEWLWRWKVKYYFEYKEPA